MDRRAFLQAGVAALAFPGDLRVRSPLRARSADPAVGADVLDGQYPFGHVRRYGAMGNGVTDDTAAFARASGAIAAAGRGELTVNDGVYLIDADVDGGKGIRLPSNCVLRMTKGATLKAMPNSLARYGVVWLKDVVNLHVIGGRIQGERLSHSGRKGEWGMGVWMNSAKSCSVRQTVISDFWGDGICICSVDPVAGTECQDILLDGIHCDNNRRQGVSVVSAKRVRILNSRFTRTAGTPPSAGIDFEPDPGTAVVEDCTVTNCTFDDNVIGVQFVGPCRRVTVAGNQFRGNRSYGVYMIRDVQEGVVDGNMVLQEDDQTTGIHLEAVRGARVTNNVIRGAFKHAVGQHRASNNHLAGNQIVIDRAR